MDSKRITKAEIKDAYRVINDPNVGEAVKDFYREKLKAHEKATVSGGTRKN
jgi:hypothetical protein